MSTLSLHLWPVYQWPPFHWEWVTSSLTAAGGGIEKKGQGHEEIRLSSKKGTARVCLQTKARTVFGKLFLRNACTYFSGNEGVENHILHLTLHTHTHTHTHTDTLWWSLINKLAWASATYVALFLSRVGKSNFLATMFGCGLWTGWDSKRIKLNDKQRAKTGIESSTDAMIWSSA